MSVNAILEALDRVSAEVSEMRKAVAAANPAGIKQAAHDGAVAGGKAVTQTAAAQVTNLGDAVRALALATTDAKHAAEAAQAAAEAAEKARQDWFVGLVPRIATAFGIALVCLITGNWYGEQQARQSATADAAWARAFTPQQRDVAAIAVREIAGKAGWFTDAKTIAAQVQAATAVNAEDVVWLASPQARTMRQIAAIAPASGQGNGAPWPCMGWAQQGWTMNRAPVTVCVVRLP
jgi:hypothetical protein